MLSFDFKTPPFKGWIELVGPLLRRFYTLPEAGAPRGFGMLHGQRRAISISTDSDKPERVALAIGVNDGGPFAGREAEIADFVPRMSHGAGCLSVGRLSSLGARGEFPRAGPRWRRRKKVHPWLRCEGRRPAGARTHDTLDERDGWVPAVPGASSRSAMRDPVSRAPRSSFGPLLGAVPCLAWHVLPCSRAPCPRLGDPLPRLLQTGPPG